MAADDTTRSFGRAEKLCIAGFALGTIYQLATIPLGPSLLGRAPVLLELLRASIPSMVTGGAFARVGDASLLLALIAPLPTLMMFDPFSWWAGRLWGPELVKYAGARTERGRRRIARGLGWAERFRAPAVVLAPYLPIPSALVYALAGWTGMGFLRFLALDLLGSLSWVGLNVGLGYAIGQRAVDVAKAISHYSLVVTIGLVLAIVAWSAWRGRGGGEPAVDEA
jgi:membrane protein DedA with SNARE-associated domain